MQKLLDHTFPQPVWRLVSSSVSASFWLVEIRTSEIKQVDYYICRPNIPPLLLKLGQNWWSGIEALMGKWAIFHGFAQQDLPIHRGITVWDTEKNKLAWQEEFLIFESATPNTIWAKLPTTIEKIVSFDLQSGNEKKDDLFFHEEAKETEVLHFFQENEYFPSIAEFVQQHTGHFPIRLVEYLELEQFLFVSYFVANGKLLDNYLLITDSEGTLILHESLSKGLKGMAKDTFEVSHGFLSFVKDNCRVLVYQLH